MSAWICNECGEKFYGDDYAKCPACLDDKTLEYAKRLAKAIWEKHWKKDSPNWKPLPDLLGLLTQIDNMVAGMERKVERSASVSSGAIRGHHPYCDCYTRNSEGSRLPCNCHP